MEQLQIYIAIVNVVVLIVMAAFLAKNRDLKGRLFFAEQIQDTLRRRIKDCENACAILADARVNHESKIEALQNKVGRLWDPAKGPF